MWWHVKWLCHDYNKGAVLYLPTFTRSRYSNARDSREGPPEGGSGDDDDDDDDDEEAEEEEEAGLGCCCRRAKRAGSSSSPSALMMPSAPVARRLSTTSNEGGEVGRLLVDKDRLLVTIGVEEVNKDGLR